MRATASSGTEGGTCRANPPRKRNVRAPARLAAGTSAAVSMRMAADPRAARGDAAGVMGGGEDRGSASDSAISVASSLRGRLAELLAYLRQAPALAAKLSRQPESRQMLGGEGALAPSHRRGQDPELGVVVDGTGADLLVSILFPDQPGHLVGIDHTGILGGLCQYVKGTGASAPIQRRRPFAGAHRPTEDQGGRTR